jgi:hypothetical protein
LELSEMISVEVFVNVIKGITMMALIIEIVKFVIIDA